VRSATARRAVRTTTADLETLAARGFTYTVTAGPLSDLAVNRQKVAAHGSRHKSGLRADLGLYMRSAWEAT